MKELLSELHHSGHLTFDSKIGRWHVDIDEIQNKEVMHNVGETLAHRMDSLGENSRNVLKIAACIGNIFGLSILAALNRKSIQQTLNDLEETIQKGLVLQRISHDGNIRSHHRVTGDELFQFAHDQVQKAAYALIPESDQKYFHLQLGRLLLQTLEPEARNQQLFSITSHCNLGINSLKNNREKLDLAKLNLKAAIKAKDSAANQSYLKYSETCLTLISHDMWDEDYHFTLQAHNEAIEAAALNGLSKRMDELFHTIITKARKPTHKATAFRVKIRFYKDAGFHPDAAETGLAFLDEIGLRISACPRKIAGTFFHANNPSAPLAQNDRRFTQPTGSDRLRTEVENGISAINRDLCLLFTSRPSPATRISRYKTFS